MRREAPAGDWHGEPMTVDGLGAGGAPVGRGCG